LTLFFPIPYLFSQQLRYPFPPVWLAKVEELYFLWAVTGTAPLCTHTVAELAAIAQTL